MIDPLTLAAFVPAALALNLTPGADMLFCLAQGARGGPRAALAAAAGVSTGSMVHVLLAGLGLGALVAAVPLAFDVIRWVGVAYLVWLAWRSLRPARGDAGTPAPVRPARAFRDGMIVNLTNPKVILFILAFVPQFVDPAQPVLPQFLAFGAIIAIGGLLVNGGFGAASGGLGRALARNARFDAVLRGISATVFGALAVKLAMDGRGG